MRQNIKSDRAGTLAKRDKERGVKSTLMAREREKKREVKTTLMAREKREREEEEEKEKKRCPNQR